MECDPRLSNNVSLKHTIETKNIIQINAYFKDLCIYVYAAFVYNSYFKYYWVFFLLIEQNCQPKTYNGNPIKIQLIGQKFKGLWILLILLHNFHFQIYLKIDMRGRFLPFWYPPGRRLDWRWISFRALSPGARWHIYKTWRVLAACLVTLALS